MNDLLERFLHDRQSLDEAELAELVRILAADPAAAAEARSLIQLDDLLSRRHLPERRNFRDRVLTGIATADSVRFVRRVRRRTMPAWWRRRQAWVGLAASLLLMLGATLWMSDGGTPACRLVQGSGVVSRDGAGRELAAGSALHHGDALEAGAQGATLDLAGGGSLTMEAGAVARIDIADEVCRVHLGQGRMHATAAIQPVHLLVRGATVEATQARFHVRVASGRTDVTVEAGEVDIHHEDGRRLAIAAGEQAVVEAATGSPVGQAEDTSVTLLRINVEDGQVPGVLRDGRVVPDDLAAGSRSCLQGLALRDAYGEKSEIRLEYDRTDLFVYQPGTKLAFDVWTAGTAGPVEVWIYDETMRSSLFLGSVDLQASGGRMRVAMSLGDVVPYRGRRHVPPQPGDGIKNIIISGRGMGMRLHIDNLVVSRPK